MQIDIRKTLMAAILVVGVLPAGACTSVTANAVPGCDECGEPVLQVGPDGTTRILRRFRVHGFMPEWGHGPERSRSRRG